jgi:hypothetical protein
MRKTFTKGVLALVVVAMVALMASPATAYILNARSEEMIARSTCDRAGSYEMRFGFDDIVTIFSYLYGAGVYEGDPSNFVLIRSTLGGTNLDLDAQVPLLCRDITGSGTANGSPAVNLPLPNSGELVPIDEIGVEIQGVPNLTPGDGRPATVPAFRAYAYGRIGSQSISLYIADLEWEYFLSQAPEFWQDTNNWPWINIGLFDELNEGEDTAICAQVVDFGPLATLNISNNNVPETLELNTSDDQIGHFLPADISIEECEKDEGCQFSSPEQIQLCPLEEQALCDTYSECIAIQGDFPPGEDLSLIIRTNGPNDGDDVQSGIYIRSVTIAVVEGGPITSSFAYYRADGETIVENTFCTFEAEQARTEVITVTDEAPGRVYLCVNYQVEPTEAEVQLDQNVRFWVELGTIPCGDLVDDVVEGPTLVECGEAADCLYFPYVLLNWPPWSSGVGISNVGITEVEDMEVTARLEINEGQVFVGQLPSELITGKVFGFTLDDLANALGADIPAQSRGWLWLQGNFTIDGFLFTFNAGDDFNFGSATLPRLLDTCGYPFDKDFD